MGKNRFCIAISGASGFIGTYLSEYFTGKGYEVIPLDRNVLREKCGPRLKKLLSRSDAVINLAGAPINHRWTGDYKKELHDSRVLTTRKIVEAINGCTCKPHLLISASAVGAYPPAGCYDERDTVRGTGFLADLCGQWEEEARQVSPDVRLAITRFGVVLAARGGAFGQMVRPSRLGISMILGSGHQAFPWIDAGDLARALEYIITRPALDGVVNLVAPGKITNREFTRIVARHYHSLVTVRIPRLFFRLLLGEASTFITEGQCVHPRKLLGAGFVFNTPTIKEFCNHLLK